MFLLQASELCIGEYPNDITFHVLKTDGTVVYSNSISPQINDHLMIMTGYTSLILPDTPTGFINVSLSNKGGEFNDVSSFILSKSCASILFILTCNFVCIIQAFLDQLLALG